MMQGNFPRLRMMQLPPGAANQPGNERIVDEQFTAGADRDRLAGRVDSHDWSKGLPIRLGVTIPKSSGGIGNADVNQGYSRIRVCERRICGYTLINKEEHPHDPDDGIRHGGDG